MPENQINSSFYPIEAERQLNDLVKFSISFPFRIIYSMARAGVRSQSPSIFVVVERVDSTLTNI